MYMYMHENHDIGYNLVGHEVGIKNKKWNMKQYYKSKILFSPFLAPLLEKVELWFKTIEETKSIF
jgi:hypothetical protein